MGPLSASTESGGSVLQKGNLGWCTRRYLPASPIPAMFKDNQVQESPLKVNFEEPRDCGPQESPICCRGAVPVQVTKAIPPESHQITVLSQMKGGEDILGQKRQKVSLPLQTLSPQPIPILTPHLSQFFPPHPKFPFPPSSRPP